MFWAPRGPLLGHSHGLLLLYSVKREKQKLQAKNVRHVVQSDHHVINPADN